MSEENLALATSVFAQIKALIEPLSPRDRARIIHSLLDDCARKEGGYQFLANFVNDRILLEKGRKNSIIYWRYLVSSSNFASEDRDSWVCIETD